MPNLGQLRLTDLIFTTISTLFQSHLLCCIQLCLAKSAEIRAKQGAAEDEDEDSCIQTQLEEVVESLIMRMITSEMEDFALVSTFRILIL